MDAGLRVFLQPQGPGLGRRVVGAGEEGGQGDNIQLLRPAVERVQILGGGGTGGVGRFRALAHGIEQVPAVQTGAVHDGPVPYVDGQGHADEIAAVELGGGQVAAAVHDDLK